MNEDKQEEIEFGETCEYCGGLGKIENEDGYMEKCVCYEEPDFTGASDSEDR